MFWLGEGMFRTITPLPPWCWLHRWRLWNDLVRSPLYYFLLVSNCYHLCPMVKKKEGKRNINSKKPKMKIKLNIRQRIGLAWWRIMHMINFHSTALRDRFDEINRETDLKRKKILKDDCHKAVNELREDEVKGR